MGRDHLLFHSTTYTRSRTFRHLFATLRVRWLSYIFNNTPCIYQTATRWPVVLVTTMLGVHNDYTLNFGTHIETLSKNVGKKLYALSRVIKYMSTNQAPLLMRSFIMSQFSYCPLIWMCHRRRINNQINKLYERALRPFL